MMPQNLLGEWARLLLGSLRKAGVRDVIVSPGSRSTPFLLAAMREPQLRLRSIIDERDAAFFALGLARVTGEPALLLCTSGSAAANYFPAVVEAKRAGIPLLLLTADRPLELQECDAPQTIDQVRLYGEYAPFVELGEADATAGALRGLARSATRAVHVARATPGPVHLNGRARKPLEPTTDDSDEGRALRSAVDALLAAEPTRVVSAPAAPDAPELVELSRACMAARRGVLVLGPMAPWRTPDAATLATFLRRTGFVLLAEATSQHRLSADPPEPRLDAFDALLRSPRFLEEFRPDLILQVGPPPTARAWDAFLAHEEHAREQPAPRWILNAPVWSDPRGDAFGLIVAPPASGLRALTNALPDRDMLPEGDTSAGEWLDWLPSADDAAWDAVDGVLARSASEPMAEGAAARAALEALPLGGVLVLGNSLPVREVDTFCRGAARGLTVLSQRGASGIDGLISGAAGAAAAAARPTMLLLGDVSLLHDVGGLACARDCTAPLAIVVIDNGGGRIFEQLPLASTDLVDADGWRYWSTPPHLDTAQLARAFGLPHAAAARPDVAREIIGAALTAPGATLIRLVVDGDNTAPLHRELLAAVDAAVPLP